MTLTALQRPARAFAPVDESTGDEPLPRHIARTRLCTTNEHLQEFLDSGITDSLDLSAPQINRLLAAEDYVMPADVSYQPVLFANQERVQPHIMYRVDMDCEDIVEQCSVHLRGTPQRVVGRYVPLVAGNFVVAILFVDSVTDSVHQPFVDHRGRSKVVHVNSYDVRVVAKQEDFFRYWSFGPQDGLDADRIEADMEAIHEFKGRRIHSGISRGKTRQATFMHLGDR